MFFKYGILLFLVQKMWGKYKEGRTKKEELILSAALMKFCDIV